MSRAAAPPPVASDALTAGAPDAEAARFAAALAALGIAPAVETPLLLAVSGGPDSMAMLALAARALPGAVAAASVDHRLRAGGADEAAMVAAWCAAAGVPHATLAPAAPIAGASLQARARAARYALLADEARRRGAVAIATAHHADDAAETLLMRAARGAGAAGLAGVRPRAVIAGAAVVRPLLGWRRGDLRAFAVAAGVPFVDDPANDDPRHDRTRARRLLAATPWLDPVRLARAAAAAAAADADLAALADLLWRERAATEGATVTLAAADLPREMQRRLACRAIGVVRDRGAIAAPRWDGSGDVEPLLGALAAGRGATRAGVMAAAAGPHWRFRPAPPRRGG